MAGSRKFYRDKYHGKLLGVCAGFEDYFGINALWFRLGVIVLFFTGFVFIVPIYFLIAVIADKKPPHMYDDSLDRIFSGPSNWTPAEDGKAPASRKGIES
jgi:phage shock protein C